MAKKCMIEKAKRKPKFSTRAYVRCSSCGRPKAVYKRFGVCRLCFRKMALNGLLPGVTKASW